MFSTFHGMRRTEPSWKAIRLRPCGVLVLLGALVFAGPVRAQDHTVLFDLSDAGVSKAITNWGFDVTWSSYDNTRLSVMNMGTNEVDLVRIAFLPEWALSGGNLTANHINRLNDMVSLTDMAPNADLTMSSGTGSGVDPSYKSGSEVIPAKWVQLMEACASYVETNHGKAIVSTEPFNEPDFGPWEQGTVGNLYDICSMLQTNPTFSGTAIAGPSTLNVDAFGSWYGPIASVVDEGSTHTLAGNFWSYVGFLEGVLADTNSPVNPEAHNLVEVIAGAEYGLDTVIWWGPSELTRSTFGKACQGQRLGYAEDRSDWTAAAVYRAPGGEVQAFLGSNERQGGATTYRFFSKDRDVFYNGDGPRRDFTVTVSTHQERFINVTSGSDVPPMINGRYIVVNRDSQRVMEVQGSNDSSDGANVRQYVYLSQLDQQWDITPFEAAWGDQGYFSLTAAHSGKAADVYAWSLDDEADVVQWTYNTNANQLWSLEYAEDGYFFIRNRWSGKYLESAGPGLGANIQQGTGTGGFNQQWRLIPVGAAVEFTAPDQITNVVATANARSVQLTWDASAASDLAGYTVLRSTTNGGPYDIVARGLTNNAFTDKFANLPQTYFYVVRAVDESLNGSSNSVQVSATPTGGPALIARYRFDGDVHDASENANHAIVEAGSPTFPTGQYGSAMNLNGADQYTMLPANMLVGVTNFTLALWVKWGGGGAWQHIIDCGNDTVEYMMLTPSSDIGRLRFAITTNSWPDNAEQVVESSQPLPIGVWTHVAVTRNGDTASLYTNGVLAAVNNAVTISPADFNPALNYLGESQFEWDPMFSGQLDELFIYSYALSATEIANLMNNQPPPPTVPTTLAAEFDGNLLSISWPSNYVGCVLESNSVSILATGSWFTVSGSGSTNHISFPVDTSVTNVFFRLTYPYDQ